MRRFLAIALSFALFFGLAAGSALAQKFPAKTVFIVVPYPAGGGVDTIARALALELGKVWGESVVVENAPGAGTIIGTEKVINAPKDGHRLLFTLDSTVVSNRFLYKKLPYDPDKSLAPITMVARAGQFVIANAKFPAKNLRELVEAARRSPGKIAYASYGMGTPPNLLFETLGKIEGVRFLHVPYKGTTEEIAALLAGDVQVTSVGPIAAAAMVKAGKLKGLAIGGSRRLNLFPEVPTIAESGYPTVVSQAWWGLFAPAGTSPELIERIHRDVIGIVRRPDFSEKYIISSGLDLVANTPAEFAAAIREDVKVTEEMVKAAGVEPK